MRLSLLLLLGAFALPAIAGGGPENVLVLVNDESPESLEVAHYYVHRRGVPPHHIVHLSIPHNKWLALGSFVEYTALIELPVKRWREANLGDPITTIVICRDVPIRAPLEMPKSGKTPTDFHKSIAHLLATMDVKNPIARDAELTTVEGIQRQQFGNPYRWTEQSIDPRRPVSRDFPLFCVGALNAFSVADVKKMVDRSIASDAARPRGTIYLAQSRQGDPRGSYNSVFPQLKAVLDRNSFPTSIVEWDASGDLLSGKDDVVFLMFGQANWNSTFPAKNKYRDGAVVDNLTSVALTPGSFDPKAGGQTTMCFFLEAGASAVHGCVNEPYVAAFDYKHTQITRYVDGFDLSESFYMAHPLLPWMNLVEGDPIMQPFAQRPTVAETGWSATAGGATWSVKATATRAEATIASIALYVDGALRETVPSGTATFLLDAFDPATQTLTAVATDGSPQRTQGRLVRAPALAPSDISGIRYAGLVGGKARFDLGGERHVRWYAPAAKVPYGAMRGSQLSLEIAVTALRNTVEIWGDADAGGPPAVRFFDLDGMLRADALAAAERAATSDDPAELIAALRVLGSINLEPADRDRVKKWHDDLEERAGREWRPIDAAIPKSPQAPQPKQVEALRAFVKKYDGTDVARLASQTLAVASQDLETAARRMYQEAEGQRNAKHYAEAIATLDAIIQHYAGTDQAEGAKSLRAAIQADPEAKLVLARQDHQDQAARMLKMATNLLANKQEAKGKAMLAELLEKFGDTDSAAEARRLLGR